MGIPFLLDLLASALIDLLNSFLLVGFIRSVTPFFDSPFFGFQNKKLEPLPQTRRWRAACATGLRSR